MPFSEHPAVIQTMASASLHSGGAWWGRSGSRKRVAIPLHDPGRSSSWVPPASAVPVFKRGSNIMSASIAAITAQLDAGRPVVLTFMASLAFCDVNNGIVSPARRTPISLARGNRSRPGQDGGKPYVLVRNSWGESGAWAAMRGSIPIISRRVSAGS